MGWYSNFSDWADGLKPVPKYVFWCAFYSVIFLILGLTSPSLGEPKWPFLLYGPIFGVSAAFRSERRRKHPQAPAPVTRYTNPRYLR
jgi:hypothetical protein